VNGETTAILTNVNASGANGTNAGIYTNIVTGTASNYNLTLVNGALVIDKVNATVTANSANVMYTGQAQSITGFKATGLINNETIAVLRNVAVTGVTGLNAGTYINTVSGADNNYNLTFVNGLLLIDKANLLVTADNQVRVYGNQNPTLTYTVSGYLNGDGASAYSGVPNLVTTAEPNSKVGNYIVSATANNLTARNYNFTYANGVLRINPRPVTVTANSDQSKILFTADPLLSYAIEAKSEGRGIVGLDTLNGSLSRTPGEEIGKGYLILQGTIANSNYMINFVPANFEIKAPPTTYGAGILMNEIVSNNNFQTNPPTISNGEAPKLNPINVTQTYVPNMPPVTVITAQIPVAQISNFSFKIPDQIAKNITSYGGGVTAQLADGRELPSWLKFDAKTMEFKAQFDSNATLPAEALKVSIRFGNETILVEIKPVEGIGKP
jgi:hypothetical protein